MLTPTYEQHMRLAMLDSTLVRDTCMVHQPSSLVALKAIATTLTSASASSATHGMDMSSSLSSTLSRLRLSPAEMAQRCVNGLCYNCDEKIVFGHWCNNLFITEIANSKDVRRRWTKR
jgi:hypothetical protein